MSPSETKSKSIIIWVSVSKRTTMSVCMSLMVHLIVSSDLSKYEHIYEYQCENDFLSESK